MDDLDSVVVVGAENGRGVALAALAIWALVALMKSPLVPVDIPARVRPWVAFGLGQVYAILLEILGGASVLTGIVHGIVASGLAIAAQEWGGALRKGKLTASVEGKLTAVGLLLVLSLGSSACAKGEELQHGLEGAALALRVAEPCMVAGATEERAACSDDACRSRVAAVWDQVADGLDAFRALWCSVAPSAEGCGK